MRSTRNSFTELKLKQPIFNYRNISVEFSLKVGNHQVDNHKVGNPPAGRLRRLSHNFAVTNLIHCRRVRRRNLLAKGCPPYVDLLLTKIPLNYY
jgi:hypothetical protein